MIEFDEGDDALAQIRNFRGIIRVMETPVRPETQQEYFNLNKENTDSPDDDEIRLLSEFLADENTPAETIRKVLVRLTNSADVKAFRSIESFASAAPESLRSFALLCLEISRMRIESSLSDEEVGYIAGGLGGHDQKLRFFILVFPSDDSGFTPSQLQLTQDEFRQAFTNAGGTPEVFDAEPLFLAMVVLLPVMADFRPQAESCLKEINQYGNFLFPAVYASNVEIPSYTQILDIIERMRKEDTGK